MPAAVLGTWAAILWHQYVTDVGCSLGWRANGLLAVASTLAVGVGVLAIVYLLARPPKAQRLAVARVARRHALAGGSIALASIVIALAVSDRLVPRDACAVVAQHDVYEDTVPPEQYYFGGIEPRHGCAQCFTCQ